jgi:hypothetical protein
VDSSVEQGWFVTPYYPLRTLAENKEMFKGKPLEALEAFGPVVEAVAVLHDSGIVHRDIKPENIFISTQGLILGDLGIVHFEDDANTRISDKYENVGSRDWMPGWAMGIQLDDVDREFDVFGLGKVLWAMVSGRAKLQLWYHDRPEYDLRKQFPHDHRMHWIARILQHSVVENKQDSMPTARDMWKAVDDALTIMRRGGQVINRSINRTCIVCGFGEYYLAGHEKSPGMVSNMGLNPDMHLRLFRCNHCGHIQIFQVQPMPDQRGGLGGDQSGAAGDGGEAGEMSEMNKEVEEPQEQPSDRPALREVSPEELAKILEAHRKWVESEGKEGERAKLREANLQEADLSGAKLQKRPT